MPGAYLKPAYILLSDCHSQPALSHERQTHTAMVEKLSCVLPMHSTFADPAVWQYAQQPFTLVLTSVAEPDHSVLLYYLWPDWLRETCCRGHSIIVNHREIFECADLKFTVSGRSIDR